VREVPFYRSLIRSGARLDYEQLEQMFLETRPVPADLSESLSLGRPLAQALRRQRVERGAIQIESAEPDFHFDSAGAIVRAHVAQELESHEFIEDFMLLANEQVATFLERAHVPCVYRVHDQPDPFNVDRLLSVLSALDLPTPVFDPMTATRKDVRRAMRETTEGLERLTPKGRSKVALTQQVLRAQSRAVYDTQNIGHFGLALASYCHFTSPIRRYPDLLVHRALLSHLGIGPEPTSSTLSEWAEHCSRMEREAAKVELKADDIALAHLLRRRLEDEGWRQTFRGQILSLVHVGAFVLFEDLYQGFLPARFLPGDYYELNDAETALVGRRTGAAYRLADFVEVEVVAVDEARGKVDLVLAED
jgi:ribonuclease R